jgi:pilus assembly protein CpaC
MMTQRNHTDVTRTSSVATTRRSRKAMARLTAAGAAIVLLLAGAAAGVADETPAAAAANNVQPPTSQPATTTGRTTTFVTDGLGPDGSIHLLSGKGSVITTRAPYKRVSIGQPDIADINTIGPSTVLVTAKKAGSTQLILWDDQDRSQVVDVVVDLDLAAVKRAIDAGFPDLKVDIAAVNDSIAVHGHVPTMQQAEQVCELVSAYGKVHNFLDTSGGQQVMLQVRFAEVSKSVERDLGINFGSTDGISIFGNNASAVNALSIIQSQTAAGGNGIRLGVPAGGAPGQLFGTGAAGQTAFAYFIKALRENSLSRTLAEPNLVAVSGQEASFLAGGEVPIPVPQSGTSGGSAVITIEYHEFGVRLHFTPIVLGNGRIRLKVSPEVSSVDPANGTAIAGGSVPGFKKESVSTTVELSEGDTLALGGLLDNRVAAVIDTIPVLGDIPILGSLFKSTKFQRNEDELVVTVTPRLVGGLHPDQVPLLPGEHWRYASPPAQYLGLDMGGPVVEPGTASTDKPGKKTVSTTPPPQYHGTYGYSPAGAGGVTPVSH